MCPASLGEEATRDPEADERLPHPTSFVDVPAVERVLQRAAEVVVVPLEPIPKSTILATTAAARYLQDLYTTDAQASGLLVMASYNMGETRLLRLIRTLPRSPSNRNFWAVLEKHRSEIPTETYNYVFRVVAAAVICANPRLFGFDFDPPLAPLPDDATLAGTGT